MEAMRTMTGQRMRKAVPLIAVTLCLFLVNGLTGHAADTAVFCEASGSNVIRDGDISIDISNASNGYVMVKHKGSSQRLKVRVFFGDEQQTYELNGKGQYEAFPLIKGSGTYKVATFQHIKESQYTQISAKSFSALLGNERAAFLCPNQNVWYTPEMRAVQLSYELCAGMSDEWEKLEAIYNYVSKNIMYDYMKAITVRNPYVSVVDDTLAMRSGICLDFASLLACMLRVQGIPTMLVVGDLIPQSQRHAWNKVYVGGTWMQLDATFPNGQYKQSDYSELFFY